MHTHLTSIFLWSYFSLRSFKNKTFAFMQGKCEAQFSVSNISGSEPRVFVAEVKQSQLKKMKTEMEWKKRPLTNSYCWLAFEVILIVVAHFISSPSALFILLFRHSRIMYTLLQEQKWRTNYMFMYFLLQICCPQQIQARKTMFSRFQLCIFCLLAEVINYLWIKLSLSAESHWFCHYFLSLHQAQAYFYDIFLRMKQHDFYILPTCSPSQCHKCSFQVSN